MKTRRLAIMAPTTIHAGGPPGPKKGSARMATAQGNPRHTAARKWAELSTGRTGSPHAVNLAPSATPGDDIELLTSTAAGAIQITTKGQGAMRQIVLEVGPFGLPFRFKDLSSAWAILDGTVGAVTDPRLARRRHRAHGVFLYDVPDTLAKPFPPIVHRPHPASGGARPSGPVRTAARAVAPGAAPGRAVLILREPASAECGSSGRRAPRFPLP